MDSEDEAKVYTDFFGRFGLISQAGFSPNVIDWSSLLDHREISGYIYLRYYNVVNGKLMTRCYAKTYNLTEYDDVFIGREKIYNNGGAEVYR